MNKVSTLIMGLLAIIILVPGCVLHTTQVENIPGRPTTYEDVRSPGLVQGIGIESQDIASMTDRMVRDILANPFWQTQYGAPKIIVDAKYFVNESSTRINKNIITDRLRVELNRAAAGRMIFVGRHYADMYEHERLLKREGIVDQGNQPTVEKPLGGDFRLGGRITSQDAVSPTMGDRSSFNQIVFEIVDLGSGALVWSGMYDFRKSARDDIIYR